MSDPRVIQALAVERVRMTAGQGFRGWSLRNQQRAELLMIEMLTTAARLGVDPEWLAWNSELARICLSATRRFPNGIAVDESVDRYQMLDKPTPVTPPSARFDAPRPGVF